MNEIICPYCKKTFNVEEAGSADILNQVRDHQFEEELNNRLALAEKDKESAVELTKANTKNSMQEELAKKNKELTELKAKSSTELAEKSSKKETKIAEMKSQTIFPVLPRQKNHFPRADILGHKQNNKWCQP